MTFGILVPGRFIEPREPVSFKIGVEGIFTLSAVKNGNVVRSRKFHNLITDLGLERLTTSSAANLFNRCYIGLGTTPPSVTDVQLVDGIGGSISVGGTSSPGEAPDYVSRLVLTGTSSIGQFGNNNLTEIGIGGTSPDLLFSRALILDASGNPAAFPISEEEQLAVSYEVRLHPPLTDSIHEVEFDGLREVTVRAASVTNSSNWALASGGSSANIGNFTASDSGATRTYWHTGALGPITGTPSGGIVSGASGHGGTATTYPYVSGTRKRSGRYSWTASQAVHSTLRSQLVRPGQAGYFQVQYDPPLQKTDEQTMYCEYEVAWGRHDP